MGCVKLTVGAGKQRHWREKNTDRGHAQVLITTVTVQISGLWNVRPRSFVERYGCFGENCRLQLQGREVNCTASYPTRQQSTTRTHRSGLTGAHARTRTQKIHIHIYIYIYIYIYIHTHTHIYINTHIHTYTHTYTHTYIHTYTHIHTHIRTYVRPYIQ